MVGLGGCEDFMRGGFLPLLRRRGDGSRGLVYWCCEPTAGLLLHEDFAVRDVGDNPRECTAGFHGFAVVSDRGLTRIGVVNLCFQLHWLTENSPYYINVKI